MSKMKVYGATDSGYAVVGEMDTTATVDMPETNPKKVGKEAKSTKNAKASKKKSTAKEEDATECDAKSKAKNKRKVASEGFLNDTDHVPDDADKDLAKKKKATITKTPDKKGSK